MEDTNETVLSRSLREIFGDKPDIIAEKLAQLEFLGAEIHPEEWRNCSCVSLVFELVLDCDELDELVGDWEYFPDFSDKRIIRHHGIQLEHYRDSSLPQFAGLESGYVPE